MDRYKDGELITLMGEDDGVYYIKGHVDEDKARKVLGYKVFEVSNLFAFFGFGLNEKGDVVRPFIVENSDFRGRFKVTEVKCIHEE